MKVTAKIMIEEGELEEQFVRSSGPGGQNVNKVASAVQLRFNVDNSPSLPGPVKGRLKTLAGNRMTKDGDLLIEASEYRSQDRNRQEARRRLAELIRKAATPPKRRKKTKPSRGSKERRIKAKKEHGEKKSRRQGDKRFQI